MPPDELFITRGSNAKRPFATRSGRFAPREFKHETGSTRIDCMKAIVTVLLFTGPAFAATNGSVVLDSAGNVWRTGRDTFVVTTANAFQKTAASSVCATQQLSPFDTPTAVSCSHAYVMKQDASGNVLYATYLAGQSEDGGIAITVDARDNVYVTGYTYSPDFPVTAGVLQAKNAGPLAPQIVSGGLGPFGPVSILPGGDVFVAKFASDGTLIYSTLLGGSGSDVPAVIGADPSGNVYVAGTTTSTDFPTTSGALRRQLKAGNFFAKLNAQATSLVYSTYSDPTIQAFDVDAFGDAYLTGYSQPSSAGVGGGPYVSEIDTSTGQVVFSTFLPAVSEKITGSGAAVAVSGNRGVFLGVSPAPMPANLLVPAPPVLALGPSFFLDLSADGSRILTETDIANAQFDSMLLDAEGNAYAFGHGTGALPAGPNPLLARPCSSAGGSFVVESGLAGSIAAATYMRQGDDTAVSITAPGHVSVYRRASNTTVPLDLTLRPTMNFGCLENLASGAVGPGLAPGEIFATFGSGIGPIEGVSAAPNASGQYPTSLGGVQVLINGIPAPLLLAQAGEIHGVTPFGLPGGPPATVEVEYNGAGAPLLDAPGAGVNPGVFIVGGQGAIVNQDGTVNSPANPAKLGSIVSIYATGTGAVVSSPLGPPGSGPGVRDGYLTPLPPPYLLVEDPPEVTFAGVLANVLWAGSAPGLIAGVTQINVQLPAALPAGTNLAAVPVVVNSSGVLSEPAPVSLTQ